MPAPGCDYSRIVAVQCRWKPDYEIRRSSVVEIKNGSVEAKPGAKNAFGLYDAEMGSSSLWRVCPTCRKAGCDGHRGYMELPEAVYKLDGIDVLVKLLKCVCSCGMPRFKLKPKFDGVDLWSVPTLTWRDVDPSETAVVDALRLSAERDDSWARLGRIAEACKRKAKRPCHWKLEDLRQPGNTVVCGAPHPQYAKAKSALILRNWRPEQVEAMEEEERFILTEPFLPRHAFEIMAMVPPCVLRLLGQDPDISHPKWIVTWTQRVTPPAQRPKTHGRRCDDITNALREIHSHCSEIRKEQKALKAVEDRVIPARLAHSRAREVVDRLEAVPADERSAEQSAALDAAITAAGQAQRELRKHMMALAEKREEYALAAADFQFRVSALCKSDVQKHFHKPNERERYAKRMEPRDLHKRLGTKTGVWRGKLGGKRVKRGTARAVANPSVGHDIGEVGVPEFICARLTKREVVNELNLRDMQARVMVGAGRMGGAKIIQEVNPFTGKKNIRSLVGVPVEERRKAAEQLAVGYVVERHVKAGDYVVLNRQPTLWEKGLVGGRCRPTKGYVVEVEQATFEPMNGDFDGDEVNVHVVQNLAGDAEIGHLMSVPMQMGNARTNFPGYGLVQSSRSGAYQLTHRDVLLEREVVMQTLMLLRYRPKVCPVEYSEPVLAAPGEWETGTAGPTLEDVGPPAILMPQRDAVTGKRLPPRVWWTGKQLFSALLPRVNFMMGKCPSAETLVAGRDGDNESSCVLVRQGCLLAGQLRSNTLGSGTRGFVHSIRTHYGDWAAYKFISDAQRLLASSMFKRQLSIGLDDCLMPDADIRELVAEYVRVKVARFNAATASCNPAALPREAITELQTTLNEIGALIIERLPDTNGLKIAIRAGAKGKPQNIAQIIGALGQQDIRGKTFRTYHIHGTMTRTLPTDPPNPTDAVSHGFIASPFSRGLKQREFISHCASGREGLVDTAIETAESGYIQRRLDRLQGHVATNELRQVVTGSGMMLQRSYGGDGFDPAVLQRLSGEFLWDDPAAFLTRMTGSPHRDATLLLCFTMARALVAASLTERDSLPSEIQVPVDVPDLVVNVAQGNYDHRSQYGSVVERLPQPHDTASPAFCESVLTVALAGVTRECVMQAALPPRLQRMAAAASVLEGLEACGPGNHAQGVHDLLQAAILCPGVPRWQQLRAYLAEVGEGAADMKLLHEFVEVHDNVLLVRLLNAVWLHPRVMGYTVQQFQGRSGLSRAHMVLLGEMLVARTVRARVAAGDNCGVISATCIGEPTTQMVLNTFHLAGVTIQQVTRGVPRLSELIDAADTANTCGSVVPVTDEAEGKRLARLLVGRKWRDVLNNVVVEAVDKATAAAAAAATATATKTTSSNSSSPSGGSVTVESTNATLDAIHRAAAVPGVAAVPAATSSPAASAEATALQRRLHRLFGGWRETEHTCPWRVAEGSTVKLKTNGMKIVGNPAATAKAMATWQPAVQLRASVNQDVVSVLEAAALLQHVVGARASVLPLVARGELVLRLAPTSRRLEARTLRSLLSSLRRMDSAVGTAGIQDAKVVQLSRVPLDVKFGGSIGLKTQWALACRGCNLRAMMAHAHTQWAPNAYSNNVMEVHRVLGVEAARAAYIHEFTQAVSYEGTYVDRRHIAVNSLTMKQTGEPLATNRRHMARSGSSMLAAVSFEETPGQLGKAASFASMDRLKGTKGRVFLGQPIETGTGTVEVMTAVPRDGETGMQQDFASSTTLVANDIQDLSQVLPTAFDEAHRLHQALHASSRAYAAKGRHLGMVGRVNGQPVMGGHAMMPASARGSAWRYRPAVMVDTDVEVLLAPAWVREREVLQSPSKRRRVEAVPPQGAATAGNLDEDAVATLKALWQPNVARVPARLSGLASRLCGFLQEVRSALPGNKLGFELRLGQVLALPSDASRPEFGLDGVKVISRYVDVAEDSGPQQALSDAMDETGTAAKDREESYVDACVQVGVSKHAFYAVLKTLNHASSPWTYQNPNSAIEAAASAAMMAESQYNAALKQQAAAERALREEDGEDEDMEGSKSLAQQDAMTVKDTTLSATIIPLFRTSRRMHESGSRSGENKGRTARARMQRHMDDVSCWHYILEVYDAMADDTAVRTVIEHGTEEDYLRYSRMHVIKTILQEEAMQVHHGRPGDLYMTLVSENSLPVHRVQKCFKDTNCVRHKLRQTYCWGAWSLHLSQLWQAKDILELSAAVEANPEPQVYDIKLELTHPERLFLDEGKSPLVAAKELVCLLPFLYADTQVSVLPEYM